MAKCGSCGDKKSSIERERQREQAAIKRRSEVEAGKQAFMERRAEMVARVKAQRQQAR